MICKRCNKQKNELYDIIKKIEVIESNSRYINSDFKMDDLCENCIRLMFENHRDKMISYVELYDLLNNKRNLIIGNMNLKINYELNSIELNLIDNILKDLKELIL